jgi:hypothetical protein
MNSTFSPISRVALVFLLAILLTVTGCGGGGTTGSLGINGSLGGGTTGTGGTGRTTDEAASDELSVAPMDFSGISVCCGGQCDVTDSAGMFQLFTDPETELLCTLNGNGIANEMFIIMNIPAGATSVDVFVTIVDGMVVKSEITGSVVPTEPTPEATVEPTATAEETPEETATPSAEGTPEPTALPAFCGDGVAEGGEECDIEDLDGASCEDFGFSDGSLGCDLDCTFDTFFCTNATCSEPVCPSTGEAPTCLSCECNDGFPIGDCSAICLDTGSVPTVCSGGVGCSDGSEPGCP